MHAVERRSAATTPWQLTSTTAVASRKACTVCRTQTQEAPAAQSSVTQGHALAGRLAAQARSWAGGRGQARAERPPPPASGRRARRCRRAGTPAASRRVRRSCRQPARCTSTNSGGAPVRGRRTIKTKVGLGVGYGTLHQGCLRHCRLPTRPGGALAFDVHGCCACFGLALGHCLCGSGARLAGRRGASARMQGLHSSQQAAEP